MLLCIGRAAHPGMRSAHAQPRSAGPQACGPWALPPAHLQQHRRRQQRRGGSATCSAAPAAVKPAADIQGMEAFLDKLKWDASGLVVAIAQHVDTGEVLMQAFADRNAVLETLQTG